MLRSELLTDLIQKLEKFSMIQAKKWYSTPTLQVIDALVFIASNVQSCRNSQCQVWRTANEVLLKMKRLKQTWKTTNL